MTTCIFLRILTAYLFAGMALPALLPCDAGAIPLSSTSIAPTLAAATQTDDGDDDDDSTHCMISSLGIFAALGCGLCLTLRNAKAAGAQSDHRQPDRA